MYFGSNRRTIRKVGNLFGTSVEYIKNFDPRQAMNNNFHNQNGDNVVTKNGADKLLLEMYERLLERVISLEKKLEKIHKLELNQRKINPTISN